MGKSIRGREVPRRRHRDELLVKTASSRRIQKGGRHDTKQKTSGNSVGFGVSTLGLHVELQATVAFDKSLKLSEISFFFF